MHLAKYGRQSETDDGKLQERYEEARRRWPRCVQTR